MKKLITITVLVWVLCGAFTYNAHAWSWPWEKEKEIIYRVDGYYFKAKIYNSDGRRVGSLKPGTLIWPTGYVMKSKALAEIQVSIDRELFTVWIRLADIKREEK